MKKLILFVLLNVFAFVSFSQVEEHNGKKYILPDAISGKKNACVQFDWPDSLYAWSRTRLDFNIFQEYDYGTVSFYGKDIAQLFHTDDSLQIIGIAGYMAVREGVLNKNNYLGIADTSFNILEEKVLTDTLNNDDALDKAPYFELIFDNPVKVIGDFYVMTDFARPAVSGGVVDSSKLKYNWLEECIDYGAASKNIIYLVYISSEDKCPSQTIMNRWYQYDADSPELNYESGWEVVNISSILDNEHIKGIYLFPLIKDGNDTVSSVASIDVDNYTYVFPNPASENIMVQSSFKIHGIEIFNEQGQKIANTNPNAYNTSIDVSSYPKGMYIVKIMTKSGTANKKIIVQ